MAMGKRKRDRQPVMWVGVGTPRTLQGRADALAALLSTLWSLAYERSSR